VVAHPWIEATRGCVAIERGPLVYCIEQADHPGTRIADVEIDAAASLQSAWEPEFPGRRGRHPYSMRRRTRNQE